MSTLAERIKLILHEQKVKQVNFAKTLGVSANYINLLANGKKTSISDTLAKLIEETYGYSSYWLLTGEGEKCTTYTLSQIKTETIKRIKQMDDLDVNAVLAFLSSWEEFKKVHQ